MKFFPYLLIVVCLPINAQVITDGSMGAVKTFSGQFEIGQPLGTTVGNNLFHSFQQFNLQSGESATFTGDNTLKNVISRVTGGNVSAIDGLLRSTIGNANFYFINPAGITFGANTQVDVPAAFHVSTADSLRFADGKEFATSLTAPSVLSIAEPIGFGFLGTQTANIQIQQSALNFQPNSRVSISAGNILIDGGGLINPAGNMQIYSVGKTATAVTLAQPANNGLSGKLEFKNGAFISVTGQNAGQLTLRADDVTLTDSDLYASNQAETHAGIAKGIDVISNTLTMDNSAMYASALAGGDAANTHITANTRFLLRNGSSVDNGTYAQGNAGNIFITAGEFIIDGQGLSTGVFSGANTDSAGNAGVVTVNADALSILDKGQISSSTWAVGNGNSVVIKAGKMLVNGYGNVTGAFSDTNSTATGHAGDVAVEANQLTIINGGRVSSNTFSVADAGNVAVTANQLVIDGQNSEFAGIVSEARPTSKGGNAGIVSVKSSQLSIAKGGKISSGTYASGNGGDVFVDADKMLIDGKGIVTGAFSNANLDSTGNAGNVTIKNNTLSVLNNGQISSSTYAFGNAGSVVVDSKDLHIDGQESQFAGIFSNANSDSSQSHAGNVLVSSDAITMLNGAQISSSTWSIGDAGDVAINAGQLAINGLHSGVFSNANAGSRGHAGNLNVAVNNALTLVNGAQISSSTWESGNAGNVNVTADTLLIDGQGETTGIFSGTNTEFALGNAGIISVNADSIAVLGDGQISSATYAQGNAGDVSINTNSLLIDGQGKVGGIFSDANSISTGSAGNVTVVSNELTILNTGRISSNTYAQGDAGRVFIEAGNITIDSRDSSDFTCISSNTNASASGNAGLVFVNASGNLSLLNQGSISSNTYTAGDAGFVLVEANNITLDGMGKVTEISSDAKNSSSGDAGIVSVTAKNNLSLLQGGRIVSDAYASGNAGGVVVEAANIVLDEKAADKFTGISSDALSGSGDAGIVSVTASGNLSLFNGGLISSATYSAGNAGFVEVRGQAITLDGAGHYSAISSDALDGSSGYAGVVDVWATGNLTLANGGQITSDTYANGNAGNVIVKAANMVLDGQGTGNFTGITSDALNGTGNAGAVSVTAANHLAVLNGGVISSSTQTVGKAGSVQVNAPIITMDNATISAQAARGSSGQTGDVSVVASQALALANQAKITLQNDADVADTGLLMPTKVTVTAPTIKLNNSQITTAASGNASASNIEVNFSEQLRLDPSFISTTANTGNGGIIDINGGKLIYLQDSGFTTSVSGANSNGGNIKVAADILVMNTGVIQANAIGGVGGDIGLNLNALIPSYNTLIKGGKRVDWQPYQAGLNVIQAASENGVSGTLNITAPQFDISGSISGLDASELALPEITQDVCRGSMNKMNSLVRSGQGGMPLKESQAGFIPPVTQLRSNITKINSEAVTENQTVTVDLIPKKDNSSCTAF
jgi:filamentous hemagglutinin family protein